MKKIFNNKGGLSIPMVPIVLAIVIAVASSVEYFLITAAINDIQNIMDIVANGALRVGVNPDLHKDEEILDAAALENSINRQLMRETYHRLLFENLENSAASVLMNNVTDDFTILTQLPGSNTLVPDALFLNTPGQSNSPMIRTEKTNWSSSFATQDKIVDTVVLDAVARVRLRSSKVVPARLLQYTFRAKTGQNNGNMQFNVEVQQNTGGQIVLVIRSSSRMILK